MSNLVESIKALFVSKPEPPKFQKPDGYKNTSSSSAR